MGHSIKGMPLYYERFFMKYLIALLMFLPTFAQADMLGLNVGGGQGTKTFYGADYEFVTDIPYLDVAVSGNEDYVQPYVSAGLQFEHLNLGFGAGLSVMNFSNGSFNGQLALGPEIGYMQNLNKLVYVKAGANYLGFPNSPFNLTGTLTLGFNL
jgi:hypothetical protein